MDQATAHLVSVNVVHAIIQGPSRKTAIDKRPVQGRVEVLAAGVAGDTQCDTRSHGGPDKAVYAYAREDADWWAERLDRPVTPGLFGENLTTDGLDVTGAMIGERWLVGSLDTGVELEVRMPRTPCENLSARIGIDRFHMDFAASGRTGALLKVIRPGEVGAGDAITVLHRPSHRVTVGDLATGPSADQMRRLLADGVPLASTVRGKARRVVARAT